LGSAADGRPRWKPTPLPIPSKLNFGKRERERRKGRRAVKGSKRRGRRGWERERK